MSPSDRTGGESPDDEIAAKVAHFREHPEDRISYEEARKKMRDNPVFPDEEMDEESETDALKMLVDLGMVEPATDARADVTLRINTEMRARARELKINLSRLLEETLREEIERREQIAETQQGSGPIRLALEDKEGRPYVGKLDGTLIGEAHGVAAYLATDERIILYDEEKLAYHWLNQDDPEHLEELSVWFQHDPDVYVEVMYALGLTPEIDL